MVQTSVGKYPSESIQKILSHKALQKLPDQCKKKKVTISDS